jgi:hypothetical protein
MVNVAGAAFFETPLDEVIKPRLLALKSRKPQLILDCRGDIVGRGRQASASQRGVDDFFDGEIRGNVSRYLFEETDCSLTTTGFAVVCRRDCVLDCSFKRCDGPLD